MPKDSPFSFFFYSSKSSIYSTFFLRSIFGTTLPLLHRKEMYSFKIPVPGFKFLYELAFVPKSRYVEAGSKESEIQKAVSQNLNYDTA